MTFDHVLIKRKPEVVGADDAGGVVATFLSIIGLGRTNDTRSRRSSSLSSSWSIFSSILKKDITELKSWDEGLLRQSLLYNGITPRELVGQARIDALGWIVPKTPPKNQLPEGTFHGTSRALTQVFDLIDSRYVLFQVYPRRCRRAAALNLPSERKHHDVEPSVEGHLKSYSF